MGPAVACDCCAMGNKTRICDHGGGSGGDGGPERAESAQLEPRSVRVLDAWSEMRVWGGVDERIAQIAARQRGRVARRQLSAAGVSRDVIGRRMARGLLHPHLRGVFCVGHTAPIDWGDETSGLLAVGDQAVLSHLSAAALWGLITDPGDLVHVTNPTKRTQLPGVIVHRTGTLNPKDLRIHKGLPVTSPARALLDSAPLLSDRQLELGFDRALVERLARRAQIADVLDRAGNHPGLARLAALHAAEHGPALTRSGSEEHALQLIRAAGLPPPQVNVHHHGYELDFYWPEHHLVLEVDGYPFHSTRRRFERDHRKDATLRDRGEDVIRVTAEQVSDQPFAFVAQIARALAHGRATP
jgi:very-short-patch-repair endonuclease